MNISPKPSQWEVQKETSEDLLVIISLKEDSPGEALLAFNEFHRRFKEFVWKQSWKISGNSPCPAEDLAKAIMNNTFMIVYDKAGSYDSRKSNAANANNGIELWLSGIMKNEYKRLIDTHFNEEEASERQDYMRVILKEEEPLQDSEEDTNDNPSIEKICLEKGLAQLNDRERDVLLTYFRFKQGNKQLPREQIRHLADLYRTTSENLRKIKERAFKHLEAFVSNCQKNT